MIENVRLTAEERQRLITIKRVTGIENWNVLCRWAFCLSLQDAKLPPKISPEKRGAVEMTWQTFGGAHADLYETLVDALQPCDEPELDASDWFYRHLRRGILRLADITKKSKSIEDVIGQLIKT